MAARESVRLPYQSARVSHGGGGLAGGQVMATVMTLAIIAHFFLAEG